MVRKNAKAQDDPVGKDILDQLFASDNDGISVPFSGPVCVAIGRVIVAATDLGGMVTFYRGGPNNLNILSFRVGDRKRAIEIDEGQGTSDILDQLANGLEDARAKLFLARKTAQNVPQSTEGAPIE